MDITTPHTSPKHIKPDEQDIHDGSNRVIITAQTGLDGYRLRNFYITNAFQGFVWMIFHFSVVFFFTFLLKEVFLVGIFLGFANFIAFLLDIPLGIIQRYIPTKRLFVIGAVSQLVATGIFLAFIFKIFSIMGAVGSAITPDNLKDGTEWFFGSAINWIGVLVASICYGLTKEINDVATYGYVLSRADPSEYPTILARNNISFGIGSVSGLVLSGVILSVSPGFAAIVLGLIIVGFLFFTLRFFDNALDSVTVQDIENFKVSVQRFNTENVKEYLVETVKKADIGTVIQHAKYLMLKPKQKIEEKQKVPWKEVYVSSIKEFKIIWRIVAHKPSHLNLFWTISLVLIFGFWDTFASSFLLDFLDDIKPGWSYVLLALIGVPGIILQEFASKLATKIGIKTVGIIGLTLSALSLLLMGVFSLGSSVSPVIIMGLAFINSIGYACGMSTGQNQFLDRYNRIYAEHESLNEIDSNASSGPIKVLQNLANVIGLVLGGLLLGFGFPFFFFVFGFLIVGVLVWTIIERGNIRL